MKTAQNSQPGPTDTQLTLPPIAVLGAGSWGTALGIQLARAHHAALLWGHNATHLATLARDRCNVRYLPEVPFPAALEIEADLAAVLQRCNDILLVVPSHAFRTLLLQIKPQLRTGMRIAWASKGFELNSGKLPHQVVREALGPHWPMAVLSGPTFAHEVGKGLPTAITVAATDNDFAHALARSLTSPNFRVYTSTDLIGVEVGGAVKNVLAIAAALSDGLGFGANTRIALITRGLAEMMRLGVALGAKQETFIGLAGLGDLVLTCTDNQSRNRRFGLALARGMDVTAAERSIGQVVEGLHAARTVMTVAQQHQIEMPICQQVFRILYEGLSPHNAVKELMLRDPKAETA